MQQSPGDCLPKKLSKLIKILIEFSHFPDRACNKKLDNFENSQN